MEQQNGSSSSSENHELLCASSRVCVAGENKKKIKRCVPSRKNGNVEICGWNSRKQEGFLVNHAVDFEAKKGSLDDDDPRLLCVRSGGRKEEED